MNPPSGELSRAERHLASNTDDRQANQYSHIIRREQHNIYNIPNIPHHSLFLIPKLCMYVISQHKHIFIRYKCITTKSNK